MVGRKQFQIVIALVIITIVVVILTVQNPESNFYYTLGLIAVVAVLLWLGNTWITKLLDNYFPWLKFGRKRFFTHLAIGIIYSLSVFNLAYVIFKLCVLNCKV